MSLLALFFQLSRFLFNFLFKSIFYPFTEEFLFCDMSVEHGIDGKTALIPASTSYYLVVRGEPRWTDSTNSPAPKGAMKMPPEVLKYPCRRSYDTSRRRGVCFGSVFTITEEVPLLRNYEKGQQYRESVCHSSSSFTRLPHEDTSMTTDDAEASTDSDSEDEHYDKIEDGQRALLTSPLSPEAWIRAAESQWKNEVDVAMKAFRTCKMDDSDDIVAFPIECPTENGVPAFIKRNMTENMTKIQQIERWRNDFIPEREYEDISYDDADYYTTPHFQFP